MGMDLSYLEALMGARRQIRGEPAACGRQARWRGETAPALGGGKLECSPTPWARTSPVAPARRGRLRREASSSPAPIGCCWPRASEPGPISRATFGARTPGHSLPRTHWADAPAGPGADAEWRVVRPRGRSGDRSRLPAHRGASAGARRCCTQRVTLVAAPAVASLIRGRAACRVQRAVATGTVEDAGVNGVSRPRIACCDCLLRLNSRRCDAEWSPPVGSSDL